MSPAVHVHIAATANAYELVRGQQCLDVRTENYTTFKDYDEYREFIIQS